MEKDPLGLLEDGAEEVIVERDAGLLQWEHDRIIVHRVTFKRMLAIGQKAFPGMWALYCFYFNKAREDETNQPWAVDKYCMKGLGWSKDRFHKAKKLLLEHGFIESVVKRNEANNLIAKHYIKVNCMNSTTSFKSPEKPTSRKTLLVEKPETSALTIEQEVLKQKNDNVTLEIVSSFDTLKIPKKDRMLWLNQHKDNPEYLKRQLQYAVEKIDVIQNIVKWLQAALDNDYAGGDSEASEEREREAEISKERENNEARALDRDVNDMIPGDTEAGRYAETQDAKKTLNGFLMKYKEHPDIATKCREILTDLQEDGDGETAINRMFKELKPKINAIQDNQPMVGA